MENKETEKVTAENVVCIKKTQTTITSCFPETVNEIIEGFA